jgi:hypothetical protein
LIINNLGKAVLIDRIKDINNKLLKELSAEKKGEKLAEAGKTEISKIEAD